LKTVYVVLISFFGGFAGIIAISSKRKGNVIAGFASVTALYCRIWIGYLAIKLFLRGNVSVPGKQCF